MSTHKIYTRNCGRCDREFQTDQGNRRNCFVCAPARIISESKGRVTQIRPLDPVDDKPQSLAPVPTPRERVEYEPAQPGAIESVVLVELEALDWLDTVEGRTAQALARELDGLEITGAARTSMTKQLTSMMVEIRDSAPGEPDEIDKARERVRALRLAE